MDPARVASIIAAARAQASQTFESGVVEGAVDLEGLRKGARKLGTSRAVAMLDGQPLPKKAKGTRSVSLVAEALGIEPRFDGDDEAEAEAAPAKGRNGKAKGAAAAAPAGQ